MAKFKLTKKQKSMAIGIICGLGCAICVCVYMLQVQQSAAAAQEQILSEYGGDQIDICVAKRDIVAGETISEGDIETRTWVATLLPSNVYTDKSEIIGKRVGSTILQGEPISEARFGFESDDIDIPSGSVAISIPTKDVQAVGGAIRAGMTCDVYATGSSSTSRIAESAQVLATSMSQDDSSATAWVTLAIAPDKIQEMVSAAQNLDLYLTLPSDDVEAGESDQSNENNGNVEVGESDQPSESDAEAGDSKQSSEKDSETIQSEQSDKKDGEANTSEKSGEKDSSKGADKA